ncbi:MAG: hypothetical protein WCV62_02875 [Candidatus Peribacteraceae bacterium]|jgi:preprotein translocase subunit SecY
MTAFTLILSGILPILGAEGILWLLFRRRILEIEFPRMEDRGLFRAQTLRGAGLFTLIHAVAVSVLFAVVLPVFW